MNKRLLFAAIMLAGCSYSTQPVNVAESVWQQYSNTRFGYEISIPRSATGKNTPSDAWAGFGTYSTLKDKPKLQDYQIGIRAGEELPANASCTPSLMGTSKVNFFESGSGKTMWGKVDYWDRPHEGDDEPIPTLCDPPFPVSLKDRQYVPCTPKDDAALGSCTLLQRKYEIAHGMYSAYVFCSEKDNKAVIICVSQVKDNPALAEAIFKTFRWTK